MEDGSPTVLTTSRGSLASSMFLAVQHHCGRVPLISGMIQRQVYYETDRNKYW